MTDNSNCNTPPDALYGVESNASPGPLGGADSGAAFAAASEALPVAGNEAPHMIICRPDHSELAKRYDEAGGWEQSANGSLFIVIGKGTSDNKCAVLAARFGLNLPGLIGYRDSDEPGHYAARCSRALNPATVLKLNGWRVNSSGHVRVQLTDGQNACIEVPLQELVGSVDMMAALSSDARKIIGDLMQGNQSPDQHKA